MRMCSSVCIYRNHQPMQPLVFLVELEEIPNVLKVGLVVPVYKGSNKDLLNMNSYRGITLSNVISKVLEFLLLERMRSIFHEANVPHLNHQPTERKPPVQMQSWPLRRLFQGMWREEIRC